MTDIVQTYRNFTNGKGCSNNHCVVEKRQGPGTNATCRCMGVRYSREAQRLGEIARYAQDMAAEIERLRKLVPQEGQVVVPREATEKMLIFGGIPAATEDQAKLVWDEMIEAWEGDDA